MPLLHHGAYLYLIRINIVRVGALFIVGTTFSAPKQTQESAGGLKSYYMSRVTKVAGMETLVVDH